MNPNDTDGHQVGNGLGAQQPNTMTPNPGSSFDAPQAPIISSSPDPEDKKENSITRAFGGRSRASKIAAQAPVQPSNLRQNAPDFFQQSMQQQDIVLNAAAEKKQKSKKPKQKTGVPVMAQRKRIRLGTMRLRALLAA